MCNQDRDKPDKPRTLAVVLFVEGDEDIARVRRLVAELGGATPEPSQEPLLNQSVAGISKKFGLTPRETEVLEYLLLGRRYADIASALGIAESTVQSHARAILRKTDLSHRDELLLLAFEIVDRPSRSAANVGRRDDPAG